MFSVLNIYFGKRFLSALTGVFLGIVFLVLVIDFVELMRRAADISNAKIGDLAAIAFLRSPVYGEQILPFAALFGAMIAFLSLSRKSELVIARATGISVWQFSAPALVLALLTGVIFTTTFNPMSAKMKERADNIETKIFGTRTQLLQDNGAGQIWFRQKNKNGEAIFRADAASEESTLLSRVTIFLFDENHSFKERYEADTAKLSNGHWTLANARHFTLNDEPKTLSSTQIETSLTVDQVKEALSSAETIGFWQLPHIIERTKLVGLETHKYEMQYQTLLAKPLTLLAMVLIATSVSLSVFRFGGVFRMILSGIAAGFVLYVLSKLAGDLGEAGLLSPFVAAWLPSTLGAVVGTVVLLFREDG